MLPFALCRPQSTFAAAAVNSARCFASFDDRKIELPVKLKVHDSIFVPLAKWSMLLAGNYHCITEDGMRTAREAARSNIEESRSVYNFVLDLCVKLGANPNDLVPFEKYAAAALSLTPREDRGLGVSAGSTAGRLL